MIAIPLSQGNWTYIDQEDFELVSRYKWHTHNEKNVSYAVTMIRRPDGKQTPLRMHRLILGFPDSLIDHIDRDGLNNRRSNLRLATQSQNTCNYMHQRPNKTGFTGVCLILRKGRQPRYRASIVKNQKKILLGHFKTPQEAAQAYDQAALDLHGNFARTNATF